VKLLLAQNLFHVPAHGGASKSNRLIVERLARRGHDCHVVAPTTGRMSHLDPAVLPGHLASLGAEVLEHDDRVLRYRLAGVTVHGVLRGRDLPRTVGQVTEELRPDWALVPSDDPGQLVLSSVRRRTDRVVYFVHTLQQLPFGPRAFYPSESSTRLIRRSAGVVSVSHAAQHYVRQWAEIDSEVIYPDVYSTSDVRAAEPAGRRYVTLVNPCGYKGVDIFLALADALPDVPFLAVESWGTTDRDRAALAARPNVVVQPSVDDMNEVYRRTRVLVMPSLWDETFGYTSVEALLRGIPVLAADVGGLREATLGVAPLLAVRPIVDYSRDVVAALPDAEVPEQDTGPWLAALRRLLTDQEFYRRTSELSAAAAGRFVAGLEPDAVEKYLMDLEGVRGDER
jgi:glycosyltransferase involved in cell wall biosynthesis